MDLMQALNVTIYGLGIVFMALLVLMLAIMLLSKAFSLATGKELMQAPAQAPEPVAAASYVPTVAAAEVAPFVAATAAPAAPSLASAPVAPVVGPVDFVTAPLPGKILSVAVKVGDSVRKGDELCVIEAMKMGNSIKAPRDGVVKEINVSAGETVGFGAPLVGVASVGAAPQAAPVQAAAPAPAPVTPTPAPAAAAVPSAAGIFKMGVDGGEYKVELSNVSDRAATVVVNGTSFRVDRDRPDASTIMVDGHPHTVEVKEVAADSAIVVVDGIQQRVQLGKTTSSQPSAMRLGVGGNEFQIQVSDATDADAVVTINGTSFKVLRDKTAPNKVMVNGKAHTVEVRDISGDIATVIIDAEEHRVSVARAAAAPAAPVYTPPAPVAAAPRPAPAPATAPAAPKVGAALEAVTAPLPGKVLSVAVKPGDAVARGQELCVIEAMKMGNSIKAQRNGVIAQVLVSAGETVGYGTKLFMIE